MKKLAIITGGTDGIGLEIFKSLHEEYEVFLIGKSKEKIDKIKKIYGKKNVNYFCVDLSDHREINFLLSELKKLKIIHLLINNAGGLFASRQENSLGIEKTFALNHLSYFKLSLGLIENLKRTPYSQIINVASNAHKRYPLDLTDLENKKNYNGWRAYCNSKLLNILFTYEFKKRFPEIKCNAYHPGFINSNFGNNNNNMFRHVINLLKFFIAKSPKFGAKTAVFLSKNFDNQDLNGLYFYDCKSIRSSKLSYDKFLMKKLWDISLHYL